jgi:hypothetical protein
MSVSHHVVVRLAALLAYKGKFNPYPKGFTLYRLLGDDIVIADLLVALEYQRIMTSFLGVSMNHAKEVSGPGIGEFCKRLYLHGREITPITPKLVKAVLDYPVIGPFTAKIVEER